MASFLMKSTLNLDSPWWTESEYQDGELYIPGQSRLTADDRKILEEVGAAADKHELSIPAMPATAMEASRMLKSSDAELADIAKVISRDPGMTLQIMKFANSVMYGARFPIDTIDRAVSHLGMRHLQTVVLQIAMNRMNAEIPAKAFAEYEWRHALACALIAKHMGERFKLDPDICYLAGLLHDIGRLPVITALHRRGFLPDQPEEDSASEIIVESLHRGVGMQVAASWELPPAIADAIGNHLTGRLEGEESPSTFPSTKVAEAAGDLCIAIGEGRFRKPFAIFDCPSLREIGFTRSDLTK